jgi:UDP-N-acetylmuramate--alanine ligase
LRTDDATDKNVYPPDALRVADGTGKNVYPPVNGVYHSVSIVYRGEPFCRVQLRVAGAHNVLNAVAAAAIARAEGLTPDEIAAGLSNFPGLHRRLERRGTWRGATWIDDYAHHPTEIIAALTAVRAMFPGARVWCVFQPHQASRTRHLLNEFAQSLRAADRVLVADVFRAREGTPEPGEVTAADLAARARSVGVDVSAGHTREAILATLAANLSLGDVLLTLGAGDVDGLFARSSTPNSDAPA